MVVRVTLPAKVAMNVPLVGVVKIAMNVPKIILAPIVIYVLANQVFATMA